MSFSLKTEIGLHIQYRDLMDEAGRLDEFARFHIRNLPDEPVFRPVTSLTPLMMKSVEFGTQNDLHGEGDGGDPYTYVRILDNPPALVEDTESIKDILTALWADWAPLGRALRHRKRPDWEVRCMDVRIVVQFSPEQDIPVWVLQAFRLPFRIYQRTAPMELHPLAAFPEAKAV